jgi:hypothetical protein
MKRPRQNEFCGRHRRHQRQPRRPDASPHRSRPSSRAKHNPRPQRRISKLSCRRLDDVDTPSRQLDRRIVEEHHDSPRRSIVSWKYPRRAPPSGASRSRRDAPEFCVFLRAPKKQRAQGKPGARCTRSRACSVESTRVSHHRFTGTPGLPCAMVLTVSFVLSRVTGLCCHPRPQEALLLENLTPASGRQDHTTSPSATVPFVWRAICPPDTAASIASRAQRP